MDDILTRIQKRIDLHGMGQDVHVFRAAAAEIERLSAGAKRPKEFLDWAVETFGPVATGRQERLNRFVEEAIELAHAENMDIRLLNLMVSRVYSRTRGDTPKEIGQAQACLETFAESIGLSADREAATEFERVKTIPKDEWERRHAAKKEIGIAR